jgi:hypothetical protein
MAESHQFERPSISLGPESESNICGLLDLCYYFSRSLFQWGWEWSFLGRRDCQIRQSGFGIQEKIVEEIGIRRDSQNLTPAFGIFLPLNIFIWMVESASQTTPCRLHVFRCSGASPPFYNISFLVAYDV